MIIGLKAATVGGYHDATGDARVKWKWQELLGHSVLLGGPGFPCLHPAIFHVLASGDASLGALDPEDLPTIEDIPQDASTMNLIDMISKVLIIVTLYMNIRKAPSAVV